MGYRVFLSLHVILVIVLLCGCDIEVVRGTNKRSSHSSDKNTITFNWKSQSLPSVETIDVANKINKVSANSTHAFFAYRIPKVNGLPTSGLLIKGDGDTFTIVSDFATPMLGEHVSASVPGFLGEISALSAFEGGAWCASQHNKATHLERRIIALIDNKGEFRNFINTSTSEIEKLIPLDVGLLSLAYQGHDTPTLFKGDALSFNRNTFDWTKVASFNLTAAELGDAALDMIIVPKLKPIELIAVSAGGIYQGSLSDMQWKHTWTSNLYASVEIFPGAPNSMAYFQGKLVVGSFTHQLSSRKANGFILCDLNKINESNPCEASHLPEAKDFAIKKMLVMDDQLYLATSTGLLRYDGANLHLFSHSKPKSDFKDSNEKKYRAIGSLPSDDIIDIAIQKDSLWIVTASGVVKFFIE